MSNFYVLEIGFLTQYKYAWYEALESAEYGACVSCPECGRPIGSRRWLEPYIVDIKQPRNIGDFVKGCGGCCFLASDRFIQIFEAKGLTGFDRCFPVTVRKMGTTKKAKGYIPPKLFGIDIVHTRTRVNYEKMDLTFSTWAPPPTPNDCQLCGPALKVWKKIERIVIEPLTWSGEDIFYAANLSGIVLLSERLAHIIRDFGLTNVEVIPCEEFSLSFRV